MPAEASRSGRAGPEPTPDAGRRHAIDRPVRHAPQPTRRRPRFTPPARKDENPPEAIRHPARNDPPREPRKPDGRLHQSSRHRSAEAITVSSLTPELSRAAKRRRLERIVMFFLLSVWCFSLAWAADWVAACRLSCFYPSNFDGWSCELHTQLDRTVTIQEIRELHSFLETL